MEAYSSGVLVHVSNSTSHYVPDLAEMVLTRRNSAGVSPLYHLVEFAHDLRVPEAAFASQLIQELEALGIDIVSM